MSRTKLTSTILTQLQQNERLRIQLHHYQNLLREQDHFYLAALNNQQKITKDILDQLILTQVKIKQLVKSRICNNWKQEYDNLSQSISQYVKDVNQLVLGYNSMRQNWTQKMQQKSNLHKYYSQTLQECVQKFDKAQQIIEEMNKIIQDKDIELQKRNQQIQNILKSQKQNYMQQSLQRKIIQLSQNHAKEIKYYQKQVTGINEYLQALKTQNQFLISQNKKQKECLKIKQIDCDLLQKKTFNLQQKSNTLISQNQRLINLLQQMQNMQKSSKKQLSRISQNQQQIIKKSICEAQNIAYLQKMLAQVERQNNQLIKMQKQWTNTQQNYQKRIHNLKQQIQHHEQLVFDLNIVNQSLKHQLQLLYAQVQQYRIHQKQKKQYKIQKQTSTSQLKNQDQQDITSTDKKTKRKKQLVIKIQDQQNQNQKLNLNTSHLYASKQFTSLNKTGRITQNRQYLKEQENSQHQQTVLRQLQQTSNNKLNQNDSIKLEKHNDNMYNLNSNQKKFNLQSFQIKNLHFQHQCCSPKIKIGNMHNWNNFPF